MHLRDPWFLRPYDLRAIISDNQVVPKLEIERDDFYYTMIHVKDERVSGYDEEERQRQIDKLYNELIAPYHEKKERDLLSKVLEKRDMLSKVLETYEFLR